MKFKLKIAGREGLIYQGDVDSITSFNNKGKFDVLPQHANFISLIEKGIILRETEKSPNKEIKFDNALMRVRENFVEIYIGVEKSSQV